MNILLRNRFDGGAAIHSFPHLACTYSDPLCTRQTEERRSVTKYYHHYYGHRNNKIFKLFRKNMIMFCTRDKKKKKNQITAPFERFPTQTR